MSGSTAAWRNNIPTFRSRRLLRSPLTRSVRMGVPVGTGRSLESELECRTSVQLGSRLLRFAAGSGTPHTQKFEISVGYYHSGVQSGFRKQRQCCLLTKWWLLFEAILHWGVTTRRRFGSRFAQRQCASSEPSCPVEILPTFA